MSKKSTRALASATLMSLVLTTALSAGPVKAAEESVTRTSGVDRYSTAASVATSNWTTSDDVVLVSGEGSQGYADAVSASALAKKLNAPILLTTSGSLNSDAQKALTTLKAKNIYVVGGNASVSASVRTELKKTYSLVELGGANRYETNAAVAQKLVDLGVKADEVIMVGGEGFSDALSVAPIAAAKGQILLLGMNNADYMKPVIDFAKKNNSKVTVVGTKNVISDSIYNAVNAVKRVDGGNDRFDTNMKVLEAFKDTVKMDKMFVANATGEGYADALVASAVAGKTGAPLVLVDTEGANQTNTAIAYVKANATDKTQITVVGGTGVVSDTTLNAIKGSKPVDPTFKGTINTVEVVKDQYVNSKATDETLQFTINGGQKVTAQEVVNAGYSIEFTAINTNINVFGGSDTSNIKSKDGILDKDRLQTFLGSDQNKEFKYSVTVKRNDQVVAVTGYETVNVINGDATANSLGDITIKQGTTVDNATTKITSGKFIKGDKAIVTKVKGNISNASDVTITNKKFYTSDPFVATVDETTGEINTVNPGTFTLTVKSGSSSKDYSFTVSSDTSRKVTSVTTDSSSINLGKGAVNTYTLQFKDQLGDAIEAVPTSTNGTDVATADKQFQVTGDVKDGSDIVAKGSIITTGSDDLGDGKATLQVAAQNIAGTGSLKIYNKNGVMATLPITVVADTAIGRITIEATTDDSDSKDLNLDLDPKSADDNGDQYVKLSLNKYGVNNTYLGKVKAGDLTASDSITATTDSDKTILAGGSSVIITPDSDGNFVVAIPSASQTDYKTTAKYDLLNNSVKNDVGTITIAAKFGNYSSTINLNVKDTTPIISSTSFNTGLSTTFGAIQLKDVIDVSKINISTGQGDGKVRIAQDGTVFMKADASKNNTGSQDINDKDVYYNYTNDITLGRIKVAVKSGDVSSVTAISGGSFTVNSKSVTDPTGYIRIGVQRVHEDNQVGYVDVKVSNK